MRILIFLMVIIALAILIGVHLFLYFSLVHFYNIASPVIKRTLLAVFIFLSLSFILSFALVAAYSNVFTHAYYIFNAYWLAFMINFIWASLFGWIIYALDRYFSIGLNMNIFTSLLISITILAVALGAWNAQNPKIKFLTVKIKNLPADWQGKTVVQLTDVHIGVINNKKFLSNLVNQLKPIRKDIILITGDYFDGQDGDLDAYARPLADVTADKGIYFVSGNHERYLGVDKTYAALEKVGVKILKDEIVNINGLNIVGIDYPGELQSVNAEPILQKLNPEEANILLYHEPRLIELAKKYGIDLQLAGHTHAGQVWPFGLITRLIYGPYYYGLNQSGDYTIYTSSGVGTWGPPIRTGNAPEIVVFTLEKNNFFGKPLS